MLDLVSASKMGDKLFSLRGRELCEFIMKLCDCVKNDAGTAFRGGIFPGNIYEDENGNLLLGAAAEFGWEGEEFEYISPELYWDSARTPAADVYAIGLIMYAVFNDGKIPYYGECEDPVMRRMNDDVIPAPESAGRRLGEIITKCLNFRAVERYQSMDELKAVVSSCNTALFLKDAPTAEAVLKKSDNALSDIERMMVDIIDKSDTIKPTEKAKPAAPAKPQEEVVVKKPSPVKRHGELPSAPANHVRVGMAGNSGVSPTIQYTSERLERERKLAKEVKRRRRRPVIVILVLCALLIGAAFVFNRLTNDGSIVEAEIEFTEETPTPIKIINPNTGEEVQGTIENLPIAEPEQPEATPEAPVEHRYELYVEDVSWTEARARCEALGGHLVVINDADELQEMIDLAAERGVNRIWIGCYRTNNSLVWVNGDSVTFYQWGKGEPSAYDYNDDIAEDYVMLWYLNGWVYNDQRNDLMRDYAAMYSGTIAYICEYE